MVSTSEHLCLSLAVISSPPQIKARATIKANVASAAGRRPAPVELGRLRDPGGNRSQEGRLGGLAVPGALQLSLGKPLPEEISATLSGFPSKPSEDGLVTSPPIPGPESRNDLLQVKTSAGLATETKQPQSPTYER